MEEDINDNSYAGSNDNSGEEYNSPDEDFNDSTPNEPLNDRESIINNIFNTKNRIELLRHRLRGDIEKNGFWVSTRNALAPESFINKQISAMESIIDTVNSFSKKNNVETQKILHASCKAFIVDMGNCPEIEPKDFRTLAKSYEHSLELFLGLVEFGHGANVLRDISAGLNTQSLEPQNKGGFKEWLTKF